MNRIETTEYFYSVSEAIFDGFKNSNQAGTCIYINLIGSHFYLTHSMLVNNVYYDGAIFMGNGNLLSMKYICLDNNSGFRGSRYCDSLHNNLFSVFVNHTNEANNYNQHIGPDLAGLDVCHFNFNNLTHSKAVEHSPWYFMSANKASITKYCQMANTESNYISGWHAIGTSFNLTFFNYLNCSAVTQMNNQYNGGYITYTSCVFLFKHYMPLGTACTYLGCLSDGSVSHTSFTYDYNGNLSNIINFPDPNLCLVNPNLCADNNNMLSNSIYFKVLILCYFISVTLGS